ncbi:MAG: hypothetical protein E6I24_12640 [Chloroflexi bacterium]|nr:MAG: hypothetical protein E6I24_12640 [Chloroflexota bacterium]
MTRIKVCGNTQRADVQLAVELGVDLLGFIFTRSKRQVRVDQAQALLADVPDTIERVGVFVDEPPDRRRRAGMRPDRDPGLPTADPRRSLAQSPALARLSRPRR